MGRRSYQPDDAIGPGATILETIEAINLSQKELALRMGRDEATINKLIKNALGITQDTAIQLENVLAFRPRSG
jgi:HTH-type transcriptional regulator/antitoxin HigA